MKVIVLSDVDHGILLAMCEQACRVADQPYPLGAPQLPEWQRVQQKVVEAQS